MNASNIFHKHFINSVMLIAFSLNDQLKYFLLKKRLNRYLCMVSLSFVLCFFFSLFSCSCFLCFLHLFLRSGLKIQFNFFSSPFIKLTLLSRSLNILFFLVFQSMAFQNERIPKKKDQTNTWAYSDYCWFLLWLFFHLSNNILTILIRRFYFREFKILHWTIKWEK